MRDVLKHALAASVGAAVTLLVMDAYREHKSRSWSEQTCVRSPAGFRQHPDRVHP